MVLVSLEFCSRVSDSGTAAASALSPSDIGVKISVWGNGFGPAVCNSKGVR